MALSSIGDRAQSFTLRNQTTRLKLELETRSAEATTGSSQDIGRVLRGDFTPLTAIDSAIARLEAMRNVTTEATLSGSTMQSALSTISDLSSDFGKTLLSVASPGNPTSISAVGTEGVARFRTVVATLNVRIGDRTLFAGMETRSPALAPADDILDALATATQGALTSAEVETALDAWFADPAGFASVAYKGGAPLGPQMIANDEQVSLDVTADTVAMRDTLKGIAMAALLDRGILPDDADQRAKLAKRGGEILVQGATGRADLVARLGTSEGRIAAAEIRNSAESTALAIARSGIVAVDPYAAATALTDAETNLETLYAISARLARLSLANYL